MPPRDAQLAIETLMTSSKGLFSRIRGQVKEIKRDIMNVVSCTGLIGHRLLLPITLLIAELLGVPGLLPP